MFQLSPLIMMKKENELIEEPEDLKKEEEVEVEEAKNHPPEEGV